MTQAPPTPLSTGSYQKGALIGMGKTASWDYPYVRLLKDWTCTSYQSINQNTGQQETLLSTPVENIDAEYYWPEWKASIDYSNQATKPWCEWRVLHNNFYYEPTFWLSAAQTGKPPSTAEAQVGDYVNKDLDGGQLRTPKTRCKNQSNPIRVWMCLGTMEENNGWKTYFGSYNYDPESGDRASDFGPVFLNELVVDPTKIGGFGPYGGYSEKYAPSMYSGREYVIDTENSKNGNTVVKEYVGTAEQVKNQTYEPVFWNGATGEMPTKDVACGSPYIRYHSEAPGAHILNGISVNLWYQKVTFKSYGVKKVKQLDPAGVEISIDMVQADKIETAPIGEDKVHLVDINPGSGYGLGFWGFGSYLPGGFLLYGFDNKQTSGGTWPNTWYRSESRSALFGDTNHPLVMTRKKSYYIYTDTINTTWGWHYYPNPYNYDPPPRTKVLLDTSWTVAYEKKEAQMGENQSQLFGSDKNGKFHWENEAHQLATWMASSIDSNTELHYQGIDKNFYYMDGAWADD